MSHRHNIYTSFDFEITSATQSGLLLWLRAGLDVMAVHRLLAFSARLRAFRDCMAGATLSGRTAGSRLAPLSLGDVSPQRNVDPDDQETGHGAINVVDRENGRGSASTMR